MATELPTLRWGIIATGWAASNFVSDLQIEHPDAKAKHIIQAVGSSSIAEGQDFVRKNHLSAASVYATYKEVYEDESVDIVYIATAHTLHKRDCLDAIRHKKHVLCGSPFTANANEAEEVLAAASSQGVFIMEGMRTRFGAPFRTLQEVLHEEKIIGDIHRVFCDFAVDVGVTNSRPGSRLKDPALGAGSLMAYGIYSLTWGLLALDDKIGEAATQPNIQSAQVIVDGIDVSTSVILTYPQSRRQGIITSNMSVDTDSAFAIIEGSKGIIRVEGNSACSPSRFVVSFRGGGAEDQVYQFRRYGEGFHYEADAVALDIAAGRKQNKVMPPTETMRIWRIIDGIRKQSGP